MFRLHEATIIRTYVSENVKVKLYGCSHTHNFKFMAQIMECKFAVGDPVVQLGETTFGLPFNTVIFKGGGALPFIRAIQLLDFPV